MARYPYSDPTARRIQRVLGTPLNDGTNRVVKGERIVSGADQTRVDATQARNAEFSATTGGRPLGGYDGDAANAAASARLDPRSNANLRPVGPVDPVLAAGRQQLAALNGVVPGRNYSPEALGRATLPQVQGELAALPERRSLVNDFMTGRDRQAKLAAEQAETATAEAEIGALNRNADQMLSISDQMQRPALGATPMPAQRGSLVDDFLQGGNRTAPTPLPALGGVLRPEVRARAEEFSDGPLAEFRRGGGRITPELAGKAALAKKPKEAATGGFTTADEARKSIPEGSKGQVSQNSAGRWVVQYQVGDEGKESGPQSGLAKMQADLARAEKEGRTADASALRAQIENDANPVGRPLSVMEFNFSPELRKEHNGDYGRYRRAFGEQAASATKAPAQAAAPAEPKRVTSKAEYDALPAGARYIGADGLAATKGKRQAAPAKPAAR